MIDREVYAPGPAGGAEVRKEGEKWTLILVRETAASEGEGLGGADGSGAVAGVGSIRCGPESGGNGIGEFDVGGDADDDSGGGDAGGRSERARVWRHAMGTGGSGRRNEADAVA